MHFRVVIPARFASTRLPGKPLRMIAGMPMIHHVWLRARESGAEDIIVATDDERIAARCRDFGAEVCMTRAEHASGTDRIAEVAERMRWADDVIVVNLQGDEPLMPPGNLRHVAELLTLNPDAAIATLCIPVADEREFHDPAVVKVVHDQQGRALYFSRSPIPYEREGGGHCPRSALRHLGLYAYRVSALRRLSATPPCDLEMSEKLEQLRAMWLGLVIQVDVAPADAGRGVDTPEDLEAVERLLKP